MFGFDYWIDNRSINVIGYVKFFVYGGVGGLIGFICIYGNINIKCDVVVFVFFWKVSGYKFIVLYIKSKLMVFVVGDDFNYVCIVKCVKCVDKFCYNGGKCGVFFYDNIFVCFGYYFKIL